MEKKVVFITGASSRLGKEIALTFAKAGYQLVLHYHQRKEETHQLKEALERQFNCPVFIVSADLSIEEELFSMVKELKQQVSKIDVLVNNAALSFDCLVEEKTGEDFTRLLKVNVVAPFLLSRELAKDMKKGSIINVASTNGIDTLNPISLDYDASKAALLSLTKNLATAYAPNIRVNAIAPGWIETEKEISPDYIQEETEKILLKRFAKPQEIAEVILFLASEKASYINGSTIRIDGGTK